MRDSRYITRERATNLMLFIFLNICHFQQLLSDNSTQDSKLLNYTENTRLILNMNLNYADKIISNVLKNVRIHFFRSNDDYLYHEKNV